MYKLLHLACVTLVAIPTNGNCDFPGTDHIFVFAIKQHNVDMLNQMLIVMSNPTSAQYGLFWTKEVVKELTSNTDGNMILKNYFQQNGVKMVHETLHGEYLVAMANTTIWESIFKVKFNVYDHDNNYMQPNPFNNYTLDKNISSYVSAVFRVYRAPQYNLQVSKSVSQQVLNSSLQMESNKWSWRDTIVSPWRHHECGIQGVDKNRAR